MQLMQHHTAQHLFAWAVEQLAHTSGGQSDQPVAQRELQHQGGSVHPDRFVVNTTLIDAVSSVALEQDPVSLVQRLEALCRNVIDQHLDVRRVQAKWTSVAQVRHFSPGSFGFPAFIFNEKQIHSPPFL
ncbi:unnamed protein product [Echinostoma caproni]|uniref:DUF2662 domain-containing protein n=1 Tax=Echinostoma caproni TaxID=27848 RepID=A0A183A4C3_9TREM|nr:unnamed protein product [Echinostoma caproni]